VLGGSPGGTQEQGEVTGCRAMGGQSWGTLEDRPQAAPGQTHPLPSLLGAVTTSWCCPGSGSWAGCPPPLPPPRQPLVSPSAFPKTRGEPPTCESISWRLIWVSVMLEKSMLSAEKRTTSPPRALLPGSDPRQLPRRRPAARPTGDGEREVSGRLCRPAAPCLPFSSVCDFPALVEATTAAVAWLTPREACWSLQRLALSLSAFTCRHSQEGCADTAPRQHDRPHGFGVTTPCPQGHPNPWLGELPARGRSIVQSRARRRAGGCRVTPAAAGGPLPGRGAPTLEAATSCAVLAAISREQTISSSKVPLPCTTRSAASLRDGTERGLEHPPAVPSPRGRQHPATLPALPPVTTARTP